MDICKTRGLSITGHKGRTDQGVFVNIFRSLFWVRGFHLGPAKVSGEDLYSNYLLEDTKTGDQSNVLLEVTI